MQDEFVIQEIPCRSSVIPMDKGLLHHIYRIPIRKDLPGGSYRQILMYDYFFNGKRRFSSARDKKTHMDRCCWGPYSLFLGTSMEGLKNTLVNQQTHDEPRPHIDDLRTWRPATERYYGKRIYNVDELPFRICSDMNEFFGRIGFDRKRRCYLHDDGSIIKYTREKYI